MEYNYISPCIPSPNVLYSCPLKSPQNQDLIGFPADSRRRPYTFRYMPPRHSSNVHACMAAWPKATRKWIECSWPSTRKTKLCFWLFYHILSMSKRPGNSTFLGFFIFIMYHHALCNLGHFSDKKEKLFHPSFKTPLQFSPSPVHLTITSFSPFAVVCSLELIIA